MAADQEINGLSDALAEARRGATRLEEEVLSLTARIDGLERVLEEEREEAEAAAEKAAAERVGAAEDAECERALLKGRIAELEAFVTRVEEETAEADRGAERLAAKAVEEAREREREMTGEAERLKRRADVLMSANEELLEENGARPYIVPYIVTQNGIGQCNCLRTAV